MSVEANFIGRPFAKPSARGLPISPDPRRKVGSALACAAASRFFLPVARTLLRRHQSLRTSAAFRGAVAESVTPFPEGRALPQEGHWHANRSWAKRYFGVVTCG